MDRLIKVYDNVIDKEYCNHLIDKFENNEALHQKFDDRGMIFTQINIQKVGWIRNGVHLILALQDSSGLEVPVNPLARCRRFWSGRGSIV